MSSILPPPFPWSAAPIIPARGTGVYQPHFAEHTFFCFLCSAVLFCAAGSSPPSRHTTPPRPRVSGIGLPLQDLPDLLNHLRGRPAGLDDIPQCVVLPPLPKNIAGSGGAGPLRLHGKVLPGQEYHGVLLPFEMLIIGNKYPFSGTAELADHQLFLLGGEPARGSGGPAPPANFPANSPAPLLTDPARLWYNIPISAVRPQEGRDRPWPSHWIPP